MPTPDGWRGAPTMIRWSSSGDFSIGFAVLLHASMSVGLIRWRSSVPTRSRCSSKSFFSGTGSVVRSSTGGTMQPGSRWRPSWSRPSTGAVLWKSSTRSSRADPVPSAIFCHGNRTGDLGIVDDRGKSVSVRQSGEYEGSDLQLPASQVMALELFEQFGQAVATAAGPSRTPGVLGPLMVNASATVLSASLPACHHAPAGASIGVQWSSASPPALILRCSHDPADGGPHCWGTDGHSTVC